VVDAELRRPVAVVCLAGVMLAAGAATWQNRVVGVGGGTGTPNKVARCPWVVNARVQAVVPSGFEVVRRAGQLVRSGASGMVKAQCARAHVMRHRDRGIENQSPSHGHSAG